MVMYSGIKLDISALIFDLFPFLPDSLNWISCIHIFKQLDSVAKYHTIEPALLRSSVGRASD